MDGRLDTQLVLTCGRAILGLHEGLIESEPSRAPQRRLPLKVPHELIDRNRPARYRPCQHVGRHWLVSSRGDRTPIAHAAARRTDPVGIGLEVPTGNGLSPRYAAARGAFGATPTGSSSLATVASNRRGSTAVRLLVARGDRSLAARLDRFAACDSPLRPTRAAGRPDAVACGNRIRSNTTGRRGGFGPSDRGVIFEYPDPTSHGQHPLVTIRGTIPQLSDRENACRGPAGEFDPDHGRASSGACCENGFHVARAADHGSH